MSTDLVEDKNRKKKAATDAGGIISKHVKARKEKTLVRGRKIKDSCAAFLHKSKSFFFEEA